MTAFPTDTFNAALSNATWDTLGASTSVTANGALEIVCLENTAGAQLSYVRTHSHTLTLTNSGFWSEFTGQPTVNANVVWAMQYNGDANNAVYFYVAGTTIYARKKIATVDTDLWTTTYSATTMKWLRIREGTFGGGTAGTIYFDTSPDGTTWTNRASFATAIPTTAGYVTIYAGTTASVAQPGKLRVNTFTITDSAENLTPGTLAKGRTSHCIQEMVASYTGDTNANSTATFEYATAPYTSWTTSAETVTYDRTALTATIAIVALAQNTAYQYRVTWTNASGNVLGNNPTYSAIITTLTRPSFPGNDQYPGMRPCLFSTAPDTDTNDTATTWAKAGHLSYQKGSSDTTLAAITAAGYAGPIQDQRPAFEVRFSGTAASPTYTATNNSWVWNSVAGKPGSASRLAALVASSTNDDVFLHTATPVSTSNRATTGGTNLYLNPNSVNGQLFVRESMIERHLTVGSDAVAANIRRHDVHVDNLDARPIRHSGSSSTPAIEYPSSASGYSHAWTNACVLWIRNIQNTGVWFGGNMTYLSNSTSTATGQTPATTYRDLCDQIFCELDSGLFEYGGSPYDTTQSAPYLIARTVIYTSGASSSPTTYSDGYFTPTQWVETQNHIDIMMGRTAGTYPYPSSFVLQLVGQIQDWSANDTPATLIMRYNWGSWMMSVDTTRTRNYGRAGNSSVSNPSLGTPGYDRFRTTAAWLTTTGNPTGNRTADTSSGTSDGQFRCWYRSFANGTFVQNISAVTATYTIAGVGTGSLGQFANTFIAANPSKARSVSASAALRSTLTRTVDPDAALSQVSTRTAAATGALSKIGTRTAAASSALSKAANQRTATADAALSFASAFARPVSVVAQGGWSASAGSDLAAVIDEPSPDDADYVFSSGAPSNDSLTIHLAIVGDPASSSGHIVRYRYRKAGGGDTVDLTVDLMQGASIIKTWTHTDISSTETTATQTLSGAEADAITDYGDLRIRFTANDTT